MRANLTRPVVVFSCLGHLYIHVFTAFYFVIVLSLEDAWSLPYPRLIELWTLGALLVGAAALPAGLLADRFGARALMVVFFLGIGASSVAAGLCNGPPALTVGLAGIGLFAAIYYPVGIPWLVRNAGDSSGKVLGFNGIFGSLGTAVGGLTAGLLVDLAGWRAAFIVPGLVAIATGLILLWLTLRGRVPDLPAGAVHDAPPSRTDMRRTFLILLVTMFLAGIIYQSTQTALPKLFAERVGDWVGSGATGIGVLVATVYGVAAFMQVIGGHLADRYPLKPVYAGAILLQVPLLWLAATLGGAALMLVAVLMVIANAGALPAENMLLARYTPRRRHGLVFGLKFVLAFGAGPIAVQFVAWITAHTGSFYWVFAGLAGLAALSAGAAVLLPRDRIVVRPVEVA